MSFSHAGVNQKVSEADYGGSSLCEQSERGVVGSAHDGVAPYPQARGEPLRGPRMRWFLARIFLLSSCGKLVDIKRYSIGAVMEFGILPIPLAHLVGMVLPFIEITRPRPSFRCVDTPFVPRDRHHEYHVLRREGYHPLEGGGRGVRMFRRNRDHPCITHDRHGPASPASVSGRHVSPRSARSWVSLGGRMSGRGKKERDPGT